MTEKIKGGSFPSLAKIDSNIITTDFDYYYTKFFNDLIWGKKDEC